MSSISPPANRNNDNDQKVNLRKTRQVTDDQGWTHVVKGPKRANVRSEDLASHYAHARTHEELSPAQVAKQQLRYSTNFVNSPCCSDLRSMLERSRVITGQAHIDRCVCLGLGSLTEGREASKHQLATLRWIMELLGQAHPVRELFQQDPAFNASDMAFLRSLGHTVVETPRAFEAVSRSTFLFAPHLEFEHLATALQYEVPALCVSSDIEAFLLRLESARINDKSQAIFERFLSVVDSVSFPRYDKDDWWYFTKVYWRRPNATMPDDNGEGRTNAAASGASESCE